MKTAAQESGLSRAEETLKSYECYKNVDLPCSVGITLVQDIPLPSEPKEPVKKEEDEGGESPAQVLSWLADARKHFAPKFGAVDVEELEGMLDLYLTKVSSCISKCYVPNRAAKMKRCIGDILLFFNVHYRELPEIKKTYSTYLDKMTQLMAYYIDMEIQASSRAKEAPHAIASKLTLALYTFLDKSHDHILDSILKANNMNRNFWELCSLLFSGVLKHTPNRILSDLTYVRYILVYKMWKRVVQGPEERKKVMSLGSLRLRHPPQFVERTRAGFLNGIIPKIPKKRPDVTTFLIQAKFDVKEKAKAFLKYLADSKTNVMFVPTVPAIKTDIPLLVGHLPDFGPSPDLVKMEPPEIEEDDPHNVDISGSRLMNEIWTSVNHEASFREAIRMENVTAFNRSEAKIAEKKRMLRALKLRKGRAKSSLVSKNISEVSREKIVDVGEKSLDDVPCAIVVSDDSDKGSDVEKEVGDPLRVEDVVEKQKTENSKNSNKKITREPTPVIVSPNSSERPSPDVVLLTSSQIKQEDAVSDDVVLDLPAPQQCGDVEETKEEIEPVADTIQVDDKGAVSEDLCELKEEKGSPEESEVNIRLNRDLLEHIKFGGHFQNGSTDGVQPLETATAANPTDSGGQKPEGSPEKRKREENLFDDGSWSPSGGSQEFIHSVVTNFISTYSPDEEVDDGVAASTSDGHRGDFGLGYGERTTLPVSGEDTPVPKRSRVDQPVEIPAGGGSATSTAVDAAQNEPAPSGVAEGQKSLHEVTLLHHHNCYLGQAKFRDLCVSFLVKPEDDVPSAYFKDPVTGQLTRGCDCEQCAGNFTALCSNFKCLVDFKRTTLQCMGNMTAADDEDLNQFEQKSENADHDENADEFNGEASVQLPFKKRKAFSGRDDGESQHSDASKEEELRQWPADDYPSHTPTRMFSIASLEDVPSSPTPTTGSCMFENPRPSASTSMDDGFPFGTDYFRAQPTGGGFPPFSSVVPPSARTQTFFDTSEDHQTDPDFGRRPFRTPAELKATFHGVPTSRLVNAAYVTHNLSGTPADPPPETKRSRKTSRSSRKRK